MGLSIVKRAFLWLMLLMLAALAFVASRARWLNPYRPKLERVSIPLPPEFDGLSGLKIGFVTDLHAGPFIDETNLRRATSLIADEAPDLILFGGDYVSESPRFIPGAFRAMNDLAELAPLGAFAVLGNHDISTSTAKVVAAFDASPIRLLRNAASSVKVNGERLWIVGIDETLIGEPDVERAFAEVPTGEPTIVLWHDPEFAEQAAARRPLLQLSGHSHGGQVRIPGLGALWLPEHGRRYAAGLHEASGTPVYTARGVGVYRPPMRLLCPPEVTLITLVSGPNTGSRVHACNGD